MDAEQNSQNQDIPPEDEQQESPEKEGEGEKKEDFDIEEVEISEFSGPEVILTFLFRDLIIF